MTGLVLFGQGLGWSGAAPGTPPPPRTRLQDQNQGSSGYHLHTLTGGGLTGVPRDRDEESSLPG